MPLFKIPEEMKTKKQSSSPKIKLKKGQTIDDLIVQAERLVNEKLIKYKDSSKCITDIRELRKFFEETEDDGVIGIDTETTRFKCVYR